MRAALRRAALAVGLVVGVAVLVVALLAGDPVQAMAAPVQAGPDPLASFNQILTNIRNVLMGVLVALATLAATFGGIRYVSSMGDPSAVEQAKQALKAAAVGYALAAMAPVIVALLRSVVGAG